MPGSDGLKSPIYTLNFTNNSGRSGDLCVFQQDPTITTPSVVSLAWFAIPVGPDCYARFTWSLDYSFVWGQDGPLVPGVIFEASQIVPADLSTTNLIVLEYVNGAYRFDDQGPGPAGTLTIIEKGCPSADGVSVGIGMSGSSTFVTPSEPDLSTVFRPDPEYWVAFGTFQPGEVLDVSAINNPARVVFPPGVYSVTASLDSENQWTIQPSSQASPSKPSATLAR